MIRIAFPFAGDSLGGMHLSSLALIEGLDRRTFEPLIVLHKEGAFARYLASRRAGAYILAPKVPFGWSNRFHRNLLTMVRCARVLTPFLRTHKIAVVHTNGARMHYTWALAARRAGARFVWHQRTITPQGNSELLTNLANGIFVVSEHSRSSFSGRARRRAVTLPNPVWHGDPPMDRSVARTEVLKRISGNSKMRLVAFVANYRAEKRPLVFVETAALLKVHFGDDVKCLMFGEERFPAASEVRARIAALGLERTCIRMGPRFPIEPWLAGCDLLLAPSVNEALGRTLIEAMLLGTPVVAAAKAGNFEVIDHGVNGILATADDPHSFSAAAIQLLHDRVHAAKLARAARETATQRYSVARHVDMVSAFYKSLMARMEQRVA